MESLLRPPPRREGLPCPQTLQAPPQAHGAGAASSGNEHQEGRLEVGGARRGRMCVSISIGGAQQQELLAPLSTRMSLTPRPPHPHGCWVGALVAQMGAPAAPMRTAPPPPLPGPPPPSRRSAHAHRHVPCPTQPPSPLLAAVRTVGRAWGRPAMPAWPAGRAPSAWHCRGTCTGFQKIVWWAGGPSCKSASTQEQPLPHAAHKLPGTAVPARHPPLPVSCQSKPGAGWDTSAAGAQRLTRRPRPPPNRRSCRHSWPAGASR